MKEKRKFVVNDSRNQGVNYSVWLLMLGSVCCFITMITSILALTLPYWVYVNNTMVTTVAGLTDATEVTYFYGLLRYCLRMKAKHLDRDECGSKDFSTLRPWEQVTFLTYAVSLIFLGTALLLVVLNLAYRNKLVFLIIGTLSALAAAVCHAVGVSLYQIKASVLILDIGGLTTAYFEPGFFGVSFWLGFASAVLSLTSGLLIMLGAFMWKKPKSINRNFYKTTVAARRCPYKGRRPAIISITQM